MSRRTMPEVEILEKFDGLQELSEGEKDFLAKDVLPDYIFYNKEADSAYCTSCKAEMTYAEVKGIRIGKQFVCPHCGRQVKGKSQKRHSFSDSGTGVVLHRLGNDIVVRYFNVGRSYVRDFRKPFSVCEEKCRDIVYDEDGKVNETFDNNGRWRKVYEYKDSCGYERWGFHIYLYDGCHNIYKDSIDEVLKGTRYEHCELSQFLNRIVPRLRFTTPWLYCNYIMEYRKTCMWEWMLKMGMHDCLVELYNKMHSYDRPSLNRDGKSLQECLCITRPHLQELKSKEGSGVDFMELLKYMHKGSGFKQYDEYHQYMNGDQYAEFAQYYRFSLEKYRKYYDMQGSILIKEFYIDYLKMCHDLGMDMRNTFVVFPKDLKKAHDMAVKRMDRKKLAAHEKEYVEIRNELEKKYAYKGKSMVIAVPMSCSAIANEGQALHHCVGTYIDRVCKKSTEILFVRQKEDENKSFYTMEVKDGRVIQCRGMNNKPMAGNVLGFVERFCKKKHLELAC